MLESIVSGTRQHAHFFDRMESISGQRMPVQVGELGRLVTWSPGHNQVNQLTEIARVDEGGCAHCVGASVRWLDGCSCWSWKATKSDHQRATRE